MVDLSAIPISNIVGSALSAAVYGYTSYTKSKSKEEFDIRKMIPVVITAGVIGGIAGYSGIEYNLMVDSASSVFAAVVIENVCKAFYRSNIFKKIAKHFRWIVG